MLKEAELRVADTYEDSNLQRCSSLSISSASWDMI
jgi:hypothetical protein